MASTGSVHSFVRLEVPRMFVEPTEVFGDQQQMGGYPHGQWGYPQKMEGLFHGNPPSKPSRNGWWMMMTGGYPHWWKPPNRSNKCPETGSIQWTNDWKLRVSSAMTLWHCDIGCCANIKTNGRIWSGRQLGSSSWAKASRYCPMRCIVNIKIPGWMLLRQNVASRFWMVLTDIQL